MRNAPQSGTVLGTGREHGGKALVTKRANVRWTRSGYSRARPRSSTRCARGLLCSGLRDWCLGAARRTFSCLPYVA